MFLIVQGVPQVYKYLWLRYVRGFNPDQHCAPSLQARRDPRVHISMGAEVLDLGEPEEPYTYLCAGTLNWHDNTHIVVRKAPLSSVVTVDGYRGVKFQLLGAERLAIPALPVGWQGLPDSFTTCRNFQFGVAAFGYAPAGVAPVYPPTATPKPLQRTLF